MTARTRFHYFREHAAKLVENGYEIIPVVAGGKKPAQGNEWQLKAVTSLDGVIERTPTFGHCSIGILARSTPALDFDIPDPRLAEHMLAFMRKRFGEMLLIVRYGHRPKFLIPGRWAGGTAPAKRVTRGFIHPKSDPTDRKVVVNRIEALGDGQQWVCLGDHDKAETQYTYVDGELSPLNIRHADLPEFTQAMYDEIFEEYEWAAENQFGLLEYVRPHLNGHAVNGTVYEPLLVPGRPPETEFEIARVRTALSYYSATSIGRNYDAYIEVAFALNWLQWECGLDLFMEWSARSPWHVAKDAKYWFTHPTKRNDRHPITISTLFARAKEERDWDGTVPFDELEDDDDELAGPNDDDDDLAGPDSSDGPGNKAKSRDGVKQRLAKMIERYSMVKVGSKVVVYEDYGDKRVPEFMQLPALQALMQNNFVDVPDKKNPKVVKRVSIYELWLKSPDRRTFNRVVYQPDGNVYPGEYNLWRGFAADSVAGDVQPWLDLLAALLPNERDRRYVHNWLALKVQNPGLVPGTFLIMKGGYGIGKSGLFTPIVRMFGDHGQEFDKPDQVVGKFNAHLGWCSFAVLEEAIFIGHPGNVETLRNMVTANFLMVEAKSVDMRKTANHCAFVNLTNHDFAWNTTKGERRAAIFELPDTLKGNKEFWRAYFAWAQSDAGISALRHYLESVDLSGFDVREIPKGEAFQDQIERTAARDAPTAFLQKILEDGKMPGKDFYLLEDGENRIPRDLLRDSYNEFRKGGGFGFHNSPSWEIAAKSFYKMLGVNSKSLETKVNKSESEVGFRGYVTRLPALPELRKAFLLSTGILIEVPDDDEI